MSRTSAESLRLAGTGVDRVWPVVRIVGAALIVAAVVAQLQRTVSIALQATTPHGSHLPTVVANFFSFFTIDSNVVAAVALVVAAAWTWTAGRGSGREPRWLALLLAGATTYMLVTGVVFNVLLRGIALPQGATVPWSNEVLHVVGPLVMLADLLLAPRRRALGWGAILAVIAFPLAWIGYTLVRAGLVVAPATGDPWWYPYPFLDPRSPMTGGPGGVAAYVAGIAVVIATAAAVVVWVGRRRERAGIADVVGR
ncbi:Pr6Pr family membrane protein [Myceligenerans crystallogenes]|uniref:FAR-17a/AIG1-like protein n=1 Tax=Myceligenerans crystallogenes TaxID=316335 RepID=A0ABN2NJK7_9MICO